eukprot:comp14762_c0_seq1/m.21564 comp14762_c0_seq1/g.21564  ORF comp14762_c0_seq1/g.21564 comp14762_c0_seq1/m.21564 type:complete len:262 (+) comp14762_c0_seq1:55-840(+)
MSKRKHTSSGGAEESGNVAQVAKKLGHLFANMFQAHPWHGISAGNPDETVVAYVEIVPTAGLKFELDKASGKMKIDRPQKFSSLPPNLYGFIPQTYCGPRVAARANAALSRTDITGDKDPLDIVVLSERTVSSGDFIVNCRVIGGFRMIDSGEADDKIIAVLEDDLEFGSITDISQIRKPIHDRLLHFFSSYKELPGSDPAKRKVFIAETYGAEEARDVLRASMEDYVELYGPPQARYEELAQVIVDAVKASIVDAVKSTL